MGTKCRVPVSQSITIDAFNLFTLFCKLLYSLIRAKDVHLKILENGGRENVYAIIEKGFIYHVNKQPIFI